MPNALRLLLPQDTGIDCEADMYLRLTQIFEKTVGIQMPYYGESGGVLYTRLLKALLSPKREKLTSATLQRLLKSSSINVWSVTKRSQNAVMTCTTRNVLAFVQERTPMP